MNKVEKVILVHIVQELKTRIELSLNSSMIKKHDVCIYQECEYFERRNEKEERKRKKEGKRKREKRKEGFMEDITKDERKKEGKKEGRKKE